MDRRPWPWDPTASRMEPSLLPAVPKRRSLISTVSYAPFIDHVLICDHLPGAAFPAAYGGSEPSPSPPSQSTLTSCQQSSCLDYPSMYSYTPGAGYYGQNPYPYLPTTTSAAAAAAVVNGFSSSVTPASCATNNHPSSASSSPTYQSVQSSGKERMQGAGLILTETV